MPSFSRTILAASVASLLTLQVAHAATSYTYSSTTTNTSGTATQWSAGTGWNVAPLSDSGTTLNFGGAPLSASQTLFTNNDLSGIFQLNRLYFTYAGPASGTAPTFTISGNAIEFINDGSTAPALTFAATGTQTPTVTINNDLILTNTVAAALTSSGTLAGAISGAGGITKSGAGGLTLSGTTANTYTGVTTVSAGTLTLNKSNGVNAIGGNLTVTGGGVVLTTGKNNTIADSATVTVTGGTFNGTGVNAGVASIADTFAALNVSGAGAFNAGTGLWTITGAASFTGGTATVFVGNSGTAMSVGSLSLTGMTGTAGALVSTANSFTLYGNAAAQSYIVVGSGGLSLNGSVLNMRRGNAGSRLTLNGDVTTSGSTASSISEDTVGGTTGAIALQLSGTAGNVSRTFTVAGGGADLNISVPITNGSATAATLIKEGAGTLTITNGHAANTYSGGNTVNAGVLKVAGTAVLGTTGGALTVNTGGTLDLNGTNQTVGNLTGMGGTIVNNGTGTSTLTIGSGNGTGGNFQGIIADNNNAGSGVMALTKTGTGAITLSGTNTYTGLTTISGGALVAASAGAVPGAINLNGGVLGLGAGDFARGLGTGTTQVQWTAGANGGFAAYGADRIVNIGGAFAPLVWNSTANFVTTGALILGAASADKTVDFQNAIDLNGATRTVQVDDGAAAIDARLSGVIGSATAASALTKTGSGTLYLGAANTYVGATTVSAGTIILGDASALGTTAGSTSVATGATVDLNGQAIGAENFNTLAGSLVNNSATAVTVTGLVTLAANGTIGGSGDIALTQGLGGGNVVFNKTGNGTLTLNGNATGRTTSSASTSITGGTVVVKTNGALGTGSSNTLTVTLTGAALEINGSGLALDTGLTITAGNGSTIRATGGLNATNARINISSTGTVGVTLAAVLSTDTFTIGNATGDLIGGSANSTITAAGQGRLILAFGSTYAGAWNLSSGTVQVNTATSFGTGAITMAGAKLDSGTANLALTSNNAQNWNSNFEFIGTASLNLGTGSVTLGANRQVTVTANTLTVGGAIGDGGNGYTLEKLGAGTLALNGNSTYSGGTTLTTGGLSLGNAGALGTGALTIAGGTLDSSIADLVLTTNNAQNWNAGFTFVGTQNLDMGTGAVTINANRTVTVSANTLAVGGIGQTGGARIFTKAGAGTLLLNGTNTYTGGTIISGGVLRFGTASTVPTTGSITINTNGALAAAGPAGFSNVSEWLASGKIVTSSAGALALVADESGSIDFAASGYNSLYLGSAGNVTYSGTLAPVTGGYRLGGGVGTLTVSSALNAVVALIVGNTGSVSLTAANGYSGLTTVSTGSVLNIQNKDALGTTAAGTTVATGATLELQGNFTVPGEALTLNGVAAGGVRSNGLMGVGGSTEWAGAINAVLGSTNGLNVRIGTNAGATLKVSGPIAISGTATGTTALVFTGEGTGIASGVISGTGATATVIKTGGGLWTLSAANIYTGATRIDAGVLSLGHATALPGGIGSTGGTSNLNLNGGVLGLAAGDFLRGLGTGGSQVQWTSTTAGGFAAYGADRVVNLGGASATIAWNATNFVATGQALILGATTADAAVDFQNGLDFGNAARTIRVDNGTAAVDARLSGSLIGAGGGLTKTGTGTLLVTGTGNTYTGATTVSAGTLFVSGSLSGTATGSVASGATLSVTGTGSINSASTFSVTGTMNVVDSTSMAGAVNVNNGGTLGGNGSVGTLVVASGATVAPGSGIGALHAGNTTFQAGGSLKLEIGTDGSTGSAGTSWDQLAIDGTVASTLDLTALSSGAPFTLKLEAGAIAGWDATAGYRWNSIITTTGGLLGTFSANMFVFNATNFSNDITGGMFFVEQSGNNIDLVYVPEPGSAVSLMGGLSLLLGLQRFRRRSISA